jgi:hypothetical protein
MNGGEISGNTATGRGGGVSTYNGLTFIMNGGEISGNTSNTTNSLSGGGGVYLTGSGNFIMNGGEISGNTAVVNGGGVYSTSHSGAFRISNGTIYGSSPAALANDAQYGSAINGNGCEYGTYNGDTWESKGTLSTGTIVIFSTHSTIKVVNGELQ